MTDIVAFQLFCEMQAARIRRLADPYVSVQAAPRTGERLSHGTLYSYEHGCRCPFCKNANRKRVQRARAKQRISEGLCSRCMEPQAPGASMCEAHLAQHASYSRVQTARRRQQRRARRAEQRGRFGLGVTRDAA